MVLQYPRGAASGKAYGVLTALAQDPDPEVRRTAEDGVRAGEG